MQRLHTALRYVRNRRLEEYEQILVAASRASYRIVGVAEARDLRDRQEEMPVLVLRHDVDHHSAATLAMAKIENSVGATSTFYFRWNTFDLELIAELDSLGHECSFHFETVSDYYLEKGLDPAQTPIDDEIIADCLVRLKDDLAKFRRLCADQGISLELRTVAAHGHRINRALGFPGNRLLQHAEEQFLGATMEAYDSRFIDWLDVYISDTTLRQCGGYRYGLHPEDAIQMGLRRILFLSHPSHWHFGLGERIARAGITLLIGLNREVHVFKY